MSTNMWAASSVLAAMPSRTSSFTICLASCSSMLVLSSVTHGVRDVGQAPEAGLQLVGSPVADVAVGPLASGLVVAGHRDRRVQAVVESSLGDELQDLWDVLLVSQRLQNAPC